MLPFILSVFVLLFVASTVNSKKLKVLFDTDIGNDVDDTLALFLLLSLQDDIEIIGANTIGKKSLIGARILKKYSFLMGHPDIPVYAGFNQTLTNIALKNYNDSLANNGTGVNPDHCSTDLQLLTNLPAFKQYLDNKSQGSDGTIDSMLTYFPGWEQEGVGILEEYEYDFWDKYIYINKPMPISLYNQADVVFAVGPMTNIGNLINKSRHNGDDDETQQLKIKKLVFMGGSLLSQVNNNNNNNDGDNNDNTENSYLENLDFLSFPQSLRYDLNLRIDPLASWLVFASEMSRNMIDEMAMITGNITLQCWLNWDDFDKLKQFNSLHQWLRIANNQTAIWSEIQRKIPFDPPVTDDNVAFLHDPLSMAPILSNGNEFLTMQRLNIGFALNHKNIFQTVNLSDHANNNHIIPTRAIDVAIDLNCVKFREYFIKQTLNYKYPNLVETIDVDENCHVEDSCS